MSDQERTDRDPHRLLLGLIDTVSDLQKQVDRHDTRLDDHGAHIEGLDGHMGLADGMTDVEGRYLRDDVDISEGLEKGLRDVKARASTQGRACEESCPHVHVRADISLDDGFETVFETEEVGE